MVPGVIGYIPEYRGLPEPPRRLLGLMGPIGGRGEAAKGQPRPPKSELDKEGGGAPLSFPPSLLPSPLLVQQGREGVLLPVGGGLLLARPSWPAEPLPLAPLYTGAGGTSRHNTS